MEKEILKPLRFRRSSIEEVKKIKEMLKKGMRHKVIAYDMGISIDVVKRISCNSRWQHIE
jgi:hypothetical protein